MRLKACAHREKGMMHLLRGSARVPVLVNGSVVLIQELIQYKRATNAEPE